MGNFCFKPKQVSHEVLPTVEPTTSKGEEETTLSQEELIRPFVKGSDQLNQGTGLGLSIVNKIISDHNGSINFNSQENGAKVQIILPLNNVN